MPNDIRVRQAAVVTTTTSPPTDAPAAADADHSVDNEHDRPQQVLRISWDGDAAASENRSAERNESSASTIPIAWLREHCTSATARDLRQRYGRAADGARCRPRPVLWGADVFSRRRQDTRSADDAPESAMECLHYAEIVRSEAPDEASPSSPSSTSTTSAAARPGARRLVDLLRSRGIALVRGVPTTEEGTRALALKVGASLRSTLYGPGMWATSAEASAGEETFRDSAYSSGALALHTDCGYLADPPGVQVRRRWLVVCGRVENG